jgi:hypothetical protein
MRHVIEARREFRKRVRRDSLLLYDFNPAPGHGQGNQRKRDR